MLWARVIRGINKIGLCTLVRKEVGRFLAVYTQTIVAPVITVLLYYTIFALVDGKVEFKRRSDDRVHVSVAPLPAAAE